MGNKNHYEKKSSSKFKFGHDRILVVTILIWTSFWAAIVINELNNDKVVYQVETCLKNKDIIESFKKNHITECDYVNIDDNISVCKHITNLYGRRIANNVQIFWALPVSVTFVLYYLISFFVVGLKGSLLWIKEGFVKES